MYSVPSIVLSTEERRIFEQDKYSSCHRVVYCLADDKFFILDYKTTKKGKWRKNPNTIRQDLQLRFYARVVQKEFNAKPENIQAALYYLEGPELVATRFNEGMLLTAEKELYDTFKEIVNTKPNDVWGRVGDQCKRCDYRKTCPFYSLT